MDTSGLIDPFLKIPFAVVPLKLMPAFDQCSRLALYCIAPIKEIVSGKSREMAVTLSHDAIYLLKRSADLTRRVDYSIVKKVLTNADKAAKTTIGGDAKYVPFALFLLDATVEKTDLLIVEEGVEEVLAGLQKLKEVKVHSIPIDSIPVPRVANIGIAYREPQSARAGTGAGEQGRILTREAVLQLFREKVMNNEVPETGAAPHPLILSATSNQNTVATLDSSPKTAHATSDSLTGLPFATLDQDAQRRFPSIAQRDKAVLWFGSVFHYNLIAGQTKASNLQPRFAFLTCDRLYVADNEQSYLRCQRLDDLSAVFLPKEIDELKPRNSSEPGNLCTGGVLMMWKREHDLFLGFVNSAQRQEFVATLATVMKSYVPHNTVRFRTTETFAECRAQLATPPDYTACVVDVPTRPLVAASPLRKSITAPDADPLGLAPVPVRPDVSVAYTVLAHAKVLWADRVTYRPDPIGNPAEQKVAGAALTYERFYLGCGTECMRCVHVSSISSLHVSSEEEGVCVISCKLPEHDIWIRFESSLAIQRFATILVRTQKAVSGATNAVMKTFSDVAQEDFRFAPFPTYKLDYVPVPLRSDAPNLRQRLEAFYTKYCPEKKANIDTIIERSGGRDEEVMAKLVEKYGPEPIVSTAAGPSYRERLYNFTRHYAPENVGTVDDVLKTYEGREEILFKKLVEQYGPEPPLENITRTRLMRFCAKYCPDKLPSVDVVLLKNQGREEAMMAKLVARYGPEPPAPTIKETRERLRRFYKKYAPEKMARIEAIIQKYTGQEEKLFRMLVAQYGPEPSAAEGDADYRGRLERFCMKYCPEKLTVVEPTLEKNKGKEEEMMAVLCAKYGPEPVVNPTPVSQEVRDRLIRFYQRYAPNNIAQVDRVLSVVGHDPEAMFSKLCRIYGPEPEDPAVQGQRYGQAAEVYEAIDMTAELPFCRIPIDAVSSFPNMNHDAAIFWFGRVMHWEPPDNPIQRFAFITSKHVYVAENENSFFRCIHIAQIGAIFINARRPDKESQCAILIKMDPIEHDLYLGFESDFLAKRMLWVLMEIASKYYFNSHVTAYSVESLAENGIDPKCRRPRDFQLELEPVPKRRKTTDIEKVANDVVATAGGKTPKGRNPANSNNTPFGSLTKAPDSTSPQSPSFIEDDFKTSNPPTTFQRKLNPLQKSIAAAHTEDGHFGSKMTPFSDRNEVINRAHGYTEDEYDLLHQRRLLDEQNEEEDELTIFLRVIDMAYLAPMLKHKGLTISALEAFNEDDMVHFGIVDRSERQRIIDALREGHAAHIARNYLGDSRKGAQFLETIRNLPPRQPQQQVPAIPQFPAAPPTQPQASAVYRSPQRREDPPAQPVSRHFPSKGIKTPALPSETNQSRIDSRPSEGKLLADLKAANPLENLEFSSPIAQFVAAHSRVDMPPPDMAKQSPFAPSAAFINRTERRGSPAEGGDFEARQQLELLREVAQATRFGGGGRPSPSPSPSRPAPGVNPIRSAFSLGDIPPATAGPYEGYGASYPTVPPPPNITQQQQYQQSKATTAASAKAPSPSRAADQISAYSPSDVASLLDRLSLAEFKPRFRHVDGASLLAMPQSQLTRLFMGDVESCTVMWDYLARMKDATLKHYL